MERTENSNYFKENFLVPETSSWFQDIFSWSIFVGTYLVMLWGFLCFSLSVFNSQMTFVESSKFIWKAIQILFLT